LWSCGIEIFVENCGTYYYGESEHYELGWYDLLLLVLGVGVGTVELNLARALLRYFTWRIAVVVRTKRRRYAIGNVKMR
jgi:hypothetical protein